MFKKAFIYLVLLLLFIGCAGEKHPEGADNYFAKARYYRNAWYGTYMSLMELEKKTYKLYKKVFQDRRELMTYKDLVEMYKLGVRHEDDLEFLEKVKKRYDSEIKISRARKQ